MMIEKTGQALPALGKRYGHLVPSCGSEWGELGTPRPGRVVYVHPAGRFVVIEFELPFGTCREVFFPWEVEAQ